MAQPASTDEVTRLLRALQAGDAAASERLFPHIYADLRALAARAFARERPDHTLQPTALVHEAFLRLLDQTQVDWMSRAHFFALAAKAMRQILCDHARRHATDKRGGGRHRVELDETVAVGTDRQVDVLDLDQALRKLAELDERKSRLVELRFFGGLTGEEVADVLGVSRKTVAQDWTVARLWLLRELQGKVHT